MLLRSFLAPAGLALVLALAGCASGPGIARLTYETQPAGATLYEGGQPIGVAPVMRRYTGDAQGSAIRTPEVTAVWPSGAKTTFWTYLQVGDDRITTLQRPANAPNLALDEANGAKVSDEARREQARAKASTMADQARNSARCKAQQRSGGAVIDDCQ